MRIATLVTASALLLFCASPANAADDFSGCESIPILGLNPQIRKICDDPIGPDGSWVRYRQFVHPQYTHSSCGGVYYEGGACPPWISNDVVPAEFGGVVTYIVTPDTIPPGEPGHLDNPVRCTAAAMRCT